MITVLKLILLLVLKNFIAEEVVKRYNDISVEEILPFLEINEPIWNVLPTEDDLAYIF